MKDIIYYSALLLLFLVIFTGYSFSFPPLRFKLSAGWELLGWILIFAGVILISFSQSRGRYIKGYKDALDDVIKLKTTKP